MTIRQTCFHTLDIIILVFSTMFQIYDITSCNISCDHYYMPLHYPIKENKIKIKIKSRKINKRKIKSRLNLRVQVHYNKDIVYS